MGQQHIRPSRGLRVVYGLRSVPPPHVLGNRHWDPPFDSDRYTILGPMFGSLVLNAHAREPRVGVLRPELSDHAG